MMTNILGEVNYDDQYSYWTMVTNILGEQTMVANIFIGLW